VDDQHQSTTNKAISPTHSLAISQFGKYTLPTDPFITLYIHTHTHTHTHTSILITLIRHKIRLQITVSKFEE